MTELVTGLLASLSADVRGAMPFGYLLTRFTTGNDVRTEPGFVPISALTSSGPDLVKPSHNGLFTSGTLGRYSKGITDLEHHQAEIKQEAVAG